MKRFAEGLLSTFRADIPTESQFLPMDKAFQAVRYQRTVSDAEFEKKINDLEGWMIRERRRIDKEGCDEALIGNEDVRGVLLSNNNSFALKDRPVHLRGRDFIPESRSPAMFKAITEKFDLPDRTLGEDVGRGFPLQDDIPHGNWLTREEAQLLGVNWEKEERRRKLRAGKGRVKLPLKAQVVPESQRKMFAAMKVKIADDTKRGRYEPMEWRDLPEGATVAKLFPIDQSFADDEGNVQEKYRTIFDGRGPNEKYLYLEKARVLNTLALRELILAMIARDMDVQQGQPAGEKRATAWVAMQAELAKRDGKELEEEMRGKIMWKTAGGGEIDITVEDNSVKTLTRVFAAVTEQLKDYNERIKFMRLTSPNSEPIALFTRDWSSAYFQFAMAEPSFFAWWDIDAGEWRLMKTFVLNMGQLQAIIGFWRISEFMQQTLWRVGIPAICYIDDLIVVIYGHRAILAQRLVDTMNVMLGLENSDKQAARQSTLEMISVKILGFRYTPFMGGMMVTIPDAKVEQTAKAIGQLIEDLDKHRADVETVQNIAGTLSWIEGGKPVEYARTVHRVIYPWADEEKFRELNRNRKARRKLIKALLLSKALILENMPVYLTRRQTDRQTAFIYCDAAGIEAEDASFSAILFTGEEPRVIRVKVRDVLQKIPHEDQVKMGGMESVVRITVLELIAVGLAVETWKEQLKNKYIRIFVDNSEELFALVRPGTAAAPIVANLSIMIRLQIMALGAIPYFAYVASDRNIGDIWTRPSLVKDWLWELEQEVKLEEEVPLGNMRGWMQITIGALVERIKRVAKTWNETNMRPQNEAM
jgi:hypothetical protein